MAHLISPSALSADFGNLERDIRMLNESQSDWVHCDVMDGNFVPNISFGIPVLEAIKKASTKPLDVHLMIEDPGRYLELFKKAGADILTVHQEAVIHLDRVLHAIRDLGMKAGVALNPGTPVESLREVIHLCDLVLIMSVNPGFGGQKFIPQACAKILRLKKLMAEMGSDALIEVDGGVNEETGSKLVEAGADVLVAGSWVFNSPDPKARIATLKEINPNTFRV
ncbi:MAG: ribulose-phosphate 3-epimerase [Bacteroidia bacterium]|nr:ribulose-phosphate 3-epimerase [Bacteroidia bacterium]